MKQLYLIFLLSCCLVSTTFSQSSGFDLQRLATYDTGIFDDGAAEIIAYDTETKRLFFTNAGVMSLTVLDISDPSNPALVQDIDLSTYGADVNSVSIANGIVAVAVAAADVTENGTVVFLDADGTYLNDVEVGALPDMLTFNNAGTKVVVANEGEPNDEYTVDPEGSVSIIDVSSGVENARVRNLRLSVFTDTDGLRGANIRIFGPNATPAQDLEPEFVAISEDDKQAYVVCQENNAILKINLDIDAIERLTGLGYKNHNLPENGIDASDRSESIDIKTWDVLGMYQPDGMDAYTVNGVRYIVTANEGDARDYDGFSEEVRVEDLTLNTANYPNAADIQLEENLGRLKTTTTLGDTDGNGTYEQIYSYGARSFSIWTEDAQLVYDSGNEFITRLRELEGDNYVKNRSDDKGSEPEAIEIARLNGRIYAIIVLERQSGLFIYDVTDPTSPSYVSYFRNEGDIAPEDVIFLSADESPNGQPLVITSNEVSGTVSFMSVNGATSGGSTTDADGLFDEEIIVTDYAPVEAVMPPSPLTSEVIFVGGYDIVQTTPTYGNPAGRAIAKEWHDFIGFTPDDSGESLGWVSVNHEQIYRDDLIGDGGGMTTFRVNKNEEGNIVVMDQTLDDGRTGQFFNVDFVNTVGETGMNCAGISAPNGRIWTAEEWFRSSNTSIFNGVFNTLDSSTTNAPIEGGVIQGGPSWAPYNPSQSSAGFGVRDTSEFTINAPEFPLVDGMTIPKYENFNYMVEIDPKQAQAIRKQYNWGRAGWEGGAITADGQYVYLGVDATPAPWVRYVADTPWDFTSGTLYVYKHDNPRGEKWIAVPETMENVFGGLGDFAWSVGATMFNRNEWVTIDPASGMVFWTETGRDNPGSRWANEAADGGQYAPHHVFRAAKQGAASPGDSDYWDYYGRVLYYDPATEGVGVMIEGGLSFTDGSPTIANYPEKHLSNPDGINVVTIDGQSYLMIQEDLNGTSFGRTPEGVSNRFCELYLLSTEHMDAQIDDLIRITAVPAGAEITGAIQIDDNTILVNSQHPNADNPFPYNHSLTMAIHGFAGLTRSALSAPDFENTNAALVANPVTRELTLPETSDFAIFNANGKRLKVYRDRKQASVEGLNAGTYYLQKADKSIYKFVVE